MAVGRSRVEGDALMQDYSYMSGQSVLHGTATIGGHVTATDRAVIGGNVRLLGGVRVEDDALVAGDVAASHPIRLNGHAVYRRQADLPWSLRHANPVEPGWIERMREAVEIDPAFHRAFRRSGAPRSRRSGAPPWKPSGPTTPPAAGRSPTSPAPSAAPSDRTPTSPRTAASLADEGGIDIAVQSDAAGLTGFRYLRSLSEIAAEDLPGGDRIHAGTVHAKMHDPATEEPRTPLPTRLVSRGRPGAASPDAAGGTDLRLVRSLRR